ncbi:MAG: gliding motility-associated C-terminal domain-containing protein [Crocinitomicaceae bacterium]
MSLKSLFPLLFALLSTNLLAKDLYWIGQSRDWNNPNNWSLTSGGVSANLIPRANDDVFFDENSFDNFNEVVRFKYVTLNSITVSNSKIPIFSGNSMTISKSLSFTKNLGFSADLVFESESNEKRKINTGGFELDANIEIASGIWELGNHLIQGDNKRIVILNKAFFSNEFSIKAGEVFAENVKLYLENSTIFPLKNLDFDKGIKKGDGFILIRSEVPQSINLGQYTGLVVTKGASTCGALNLTTAITSNYNGQSISCAGACDGEITVTAAGTPGPYSYQLLFSGFIGPITSNTVYPGLCPATYTIKVLDSSNVIGPGVYASCTVDEPVAEPSVLTMSIDAFINPTCHNVCDGQGFVSISGGTGSKTLVWDNGEVGTTPVNLCIGPNIATITDVNGCQLEDTLEINSPDIIDFDVTISMPKCLGDADGEIFISNETGGNGAPYTYSYAPAPVMGQNTNNGVGFSSGNVVISIFDVDGCQQDSIVTIDDPPLFTVGTADPMDLNCFGICNGQVSALPNGGVPPYSYEWFDDATGLSTGITDSIALGLCAGDYFVVIEDANGCVKITAPVTISEPGAFDLNLTKTDVACLDSCTGIVNAAPIGGTAGYSYSWVNIANNLSVGTAPSVGGLCAGFYEVTVTDANTCVSEPDTIEVLNGLPLDIVFTSVSPTCYDICNGEITATPLNQTGFTYLWSNTAVTQTIDGLCVQGDYIVTVTSDSGCVEIDTFNFAAPVIFDIVISQNDLDCFGDTDGNIVVDVLSGGNGPVFTYDWTNVASPGNPINGDFTDSIFNLSALTYEVVITDGPGGCDTTLSFNITSPPELTASVVDPVDLLCANICNGTLSALPVGGFPPYSFEWFDNATGLTTGITDSIATGLCEGTYFVVVTDANNCSITSTTQQVNSPLPLSVTLNKVDLTCIDVCTGEASSIVSGGTLNYSYSWVNLSDNSAAGSTPSISGLCPAEYELTVTDGNSCPSVIDTIEVLNALPIDVSLSSTDPTCFDACDGTIDVTTVNGVGLTYLWTPGTITGQGTASISDLCPNINYVVLVTDGNGCEEKDSVTLNDVPLYDITTTLVDVTCFGDSDGSISLTVNAGGSGVPYSFNWISLGGSTFVGQGTSNISGLSAGDYSVTIADGLLCDTVLNFTVSGPPQLIVNTTDVIQISCFGVCDGMISALPSGGSPNYLFEWIDNLTLAVISNDSVVENLCEGDYYLRVTDANGCKDSSAIISIIEPTPISVTTGVTDISCNGICDGTASVSALGGTPNYSYLWMNTVTNVNVGSSDNISGLCPGEYSIVVTDATGCLSIADTVEVLDVLVFDMTISGTDPTCINVCDGGITGVATNGVAPFIWNAVPNSGQGTVNSTYSSLCPGFYNISVIDNNGCQVSDTVTLKEPNGYDITVAQADLLCFGDDNGSISTVVNSGGNNGPYSFSWLPGGLTGAGTNTVTNLIPGPYQVTISDGTCDTTLMFTITEPTELLVDASIISQSLCEGDCSGSGQIIVTGGTPNYAILWNDVMMQNTLQIANLCPGTYTATVTDNNGCMKADSIIITESTGFTFNASKTDVTCFGACDGSATIDLLSGGTPGYIIQWNDPNNQTTATATNLCPGNYQATITDINNCDTIVNIVITEPPAITFTIQVSDTACFGSCNGISTVTAAGGQGPYDYVWFNTNSTIAIGSGTPITNLCPGNYYASIQDILGCVVITDTVEVVEFPEIVISAANVTNATCGNTDGQITVNASGGAGNFSYTWSPNPIIGQGTNTVSQLDAGLYQVIVDDANGCSDSLSTPISSGALEQLLLTGVDVSCSGGNDGIVNVNFACLQPNCSIEWYNENGQVIGNSNMVIGLIAGTYFVELTNGLGCTVIDSITIIDPPQINANLTSTNIFCNGDASGTATVVAGGGSGNLLYNWTPNPLGGQGTNMATGLIAGTWTVDVSDVNGCNEIFSTLISEPNAIIINNVQSQDISCAGVIDGSVSVSASGGTPNLSYEWFNCGSNVLVGSNSFVGGLPPGEYFVVITDGNGCTVSSNCVTIADFTDIIANIETINATCFNDCNGRIVADVSGGNGIYFYQWKDENMVNIVGQTNDSIIDICQGTYYLEVTDGNGCLELFGPIDLTQPNLPWDISVVVSDISCFGDCNGSAAITVNAGNTPPYFYSWNDPLNQTTATGINLCEGLYSVTVSDQSSCDTTVSIQINSADPINTNAIQTNILCADDCNGEVTLMPSGGTGPYSVAWSNGDNGLVSSNLCAGNVTANLIDNLGCTLDTTFVITEPLSPISVISSFSNITQCNECNGSATINVLGGTTPYTFVWSEGGVTGQGTNNVTNLCSGLISVTVTDANGCSIIESFLIEDVNGDIFSLNTADASCFNICDGTATITPTCTVPNCTQIWYSVATGLALPGSGTTISSLCEGDYIVELTNGAGCISGETFTISSPSEIIIDATVTDITCSGDNDASIVTTISGGSGAGFVYNWVPVPPNGNNTPSALNLSSGTYTLNITDGSGCANQDTYIIKDTTPIVISTVSNNITCNGFCNGNITANVTGGYGNYTYQWLNGGVPMPGEINSSLFDLCPGSYTVIVSDGNGCSKTLAVPIVISEPSQVSAILSSTDVSCFGLCDGTATVSASGGVGSYIYNWYNSSNNLIGQSTVVASNLCADDYFVVLTDANNCSVTTSFTTIVEPTEIIYTITQQDIDCFGDCNGSANISVMGGVPGPGYIYEWKDNLGVIIGANNNISSLCAGSYTIEVVDQNGCSTGVNDVNLISPTELVVDLFLNNAECNVASGSITAQVSGGTQIYSFEWLDNLQNTIVGETTNILQNIFSGTYYFVVTDANGCDDTSLVELQDNPSTTIQFDAVNNPTCFGASDGSIEISIVGTNLPLNFLWNPGGLVVEDPSNLSAGTYNLTVTDALGCESFYDTVLVEPSEIIITPTLTDPLCGECDGEISVIAAGGSGVYNYSWNTGGVQNNIQNLCGGIYELTVEDENGCLVSEPYALGNSAAVTAEAIVTPLTCFDDCNGEITVNILTGTAPFTVTWLNDGFIGLTQQNLCAGTYFIEVKDANDCVFPMVVELDNPNEIIVTPNMTLPNCGVNDGAITITSTGGVQPHTYQWNIAGQTLPTISNIGAGVYIVTVTDNNGNGCSNDYTFNLSNITVPQVSLTSSDIDCNGNCNGEIESTTIGGTPGYSYQWYTNDGILIAGENNSNLLNRCAGLFSIEVTDANNCVAYASEEIFEPTPIVFNSPIIDNVNCFGDCDASISINTFGGTLPYSYLWDDQNAQNTPTAVNLCDGTYILTLTDGNNCEVFYTDSIVEPLLLEVNIDTIIEAHCKETLDGEIQITISGGTPNYTTDWTSSTGALLNTEDIVGALPMSYYLLITDLNGCTVQDTAIIDTAVVVFVDAGLDTVLCNLDEANLMAVSNQLAADYTWFDLNSTIIGDTNIYLTGSIPTGTYSYIAQATFDGCDDYDTVSVLVIDPLVVEAGPDIEIMTIGTAIIGGDPTASTSGQYVWSPSLYLDDTSAANPNIIKPQEDGWYFVEFTDSLGCVGIDSMYVEVVPELIVPEGISPNGDDKNDAWVLEFKDDFPNLEVSVYNRWGELLFYDNAGYQVPWNGTFEGKELPVGTYYYVIELNSDLYPEPFTGPLTILR